MKQLDRDEILAGDLAKHYLQCVCPITGLSIVMHAPDDDPIVYACQLCGDDFTHWICSGKVWGRLPAGVQSLVICRRCFAAVRKLQKMKLMK
jgi:hypothetical protein